MAGTRQDEFEQVGNNWIKWGAEAYTEKISNGFKKRKHEIIFNDIVESQDMDVCKWIGYSTSKKKAESLPQM